MFYSLTGKIVYADAVSVAIECGGVAFRVTTSTNTLRKAGALSETVTLFTHLSVREDALELFGFAEEAELEHFRMLIGVNGVGPKAAVSILSVMTPENLAFCIAAGDAKSITKAPGVGPKIAQRIVLELKDRMAKMIPSEMSAGEYVQTAIPDIRGNKSEAASALMALGYSQTEASAALSALDPSEKVEMLVKQALKELMRG